MSSFCKISLLNNLNNKRYSDLNENLKSFISYIFLDIKDDDIILCYQTKSLKVNLVISVNNIEKNISVKDGNIVCVYKENVKELMSFLSSINVSSKCMTALLYYHYADGTYDGSGTLIHSFGQLLSVDYKTEVEIVRDEFLDLWKLEKVIDHVLITDRYEKNVDYFYCGDARKGTFASAEKVKRNILCESNNYPHNFMRIGVMNFLPLRRNLLSCDLNDNRRHICLLRVNIKKYIKK